MGTDTWIVDGGLGECLSNVHLIIVGLVCLLIGSFFSTLLTSKRSTSSTTTLISNNVKSKEDEEDEVGDDDRVKMVLVVRTDLEMGKGKAAAQCCHACIAAYETSIDRRKHKVLSISNINYIYIVNKL
jgi:FtsZ-interacting cell division protein ZipA